MRCCAFLTHVHRLYLNRTCDCDGDYYCHRGPTAVSIVDAANINANPAPCTTANDEIRINMAGCKLGYFHPAVSATGFAQGECQNWVWWLNGNPPQNIFTNSDNQANGDLNAMTQWNDLPLKPGDVIGFRWKDEWEECYNQFSELSVNGTVINTQDSTAVRHVYTNDFATDWTEKGFDDSAWSAPNLPINVDSFSNTQVIFNAHYQSDCRCWKGCGLLFCNNFVWMHRPTDLLSICCVPIFWGTSCPLNGRRDGLQIRQMFTGELQSCRMLPLLSTRKSCRMLLLLSTRTNLPMFPD